MASEPSRTDDSRALDPERAPTPAAPLARSVQELQHFLSLSTEDETFRNAPSFPARPTDVFIAAFPKCGATWVQQITHGLRTSGSMEFDEISQVVPWLERGHLFGNDVAGPQCAEPRLFKTHFDFAHVPKGARYITVVRDPHDVLVSMYHFFEGVLFDGSAISIEEFGRSYFMADLVTFTPYWDHATSWLEQRGSPDLLVLCYELMQKSLPETVRRVAEFMRVDLDAARLRIATEQASFAFMTEHKQKFTEQVVNLPMRFQKVRTGKIGDGRNELSSALRYELDEVWAATIGETLGYPTYADLRDDLARS